MGLIHSRAAKQRLRAEAEAQPMANTRSNDSRNPYSLSPIHYPLHMKGLSHDNPAAADSDQAVGPGRLN
jgi:hypothetical protein